MTMTEQPKPEYSPRPRQRRGNRRASSGSQWSQPEPHLAGLETPASNDVERLADTALRDQWLQEQRPPHHDKRG